MAIKEMREMFNLSQKELAEKLGVTQQRISFWETGKCSLNKKSIKKLTDFFSCEERDLYSVNFINYKLSKKIKELARLFKEDNTFDYIVRLQGTVDCKEFVDIVIEMCANFEHKDNGVLYDFLNLNDEEFKKHKTDFIIELLTK